MTSGLARLVLNKQALCGLRVVFWHDQLRQELEGIIHAYDAIQDSFVLYDDLSGDPYAVQFHQFTVEEEQQQLVLRVTRCTQVAIPSQYKTVSSCTESIPETYTALDVPGVDPALNAASASGTSRLPSAQLSIELSQQLSGMIGRSFSHTTEGFAPVTDGPVVAGLVVHTAGSTSELDNSSDGDEEQPSYWGSPVKIEPADQVVANLAAQDASCSEAVKGATHGCEYDGPKVTNSMEPMQPAAEAEQGAGLETLGSDADSPCPSGQGSPYRRRSSLAGHSDDSPAAAAYAASVSASYNSFQEISRMISTTEPPSTSTGIPIPTKRRSGAKHHHLSGVAARLLEETGTWGTPKEGSPWGTPRDLQPADTGAADTRTAATSAAAVAQRVLTGLPNPDQARLCQQQQQLPSAAQGAGHLCLLGTDVSDSFDAAADSRMIAAAGTESSISVTAAGYHGNPDFDFTIAAGVDVQPRPTSRTAARSARELYLIHSPDATDAGMMVDIPQPLSSRRVSRTSLRAMQLGSDPGSAAVATGLPVAAELRRATSNMSSLPSRRMSRTISNRLNADQDWTGHNTAAPPQQQQQQLPPYLPGQNLAFSGGGAAMHVPGPTSRRTSRTFSGRLPQDQNENMSVTALPDDAAPDVSVRPFAASGLETMVSRRQSSANARPGTPDSDGFGYSEFEGIEPLVPPELAQWDAREEAVAYAGDTTAATHSSHRHQRRSLRNLGATTAAPAATQRPSMRVSDQDDHGSFSPASTGAPSSSLHPDASGECISPAAEEPYSWADQAPQSLAAGSRAVPSSQAAHHTRMPDSGLSTGFGGAVGSSAAEPGSGSVQVSRTSSKKASLGGILQVAAAAAEAAAATVGLALSGNKAAADEEQDESKAPRQSTSAAATVPPQQPFAAGTACEQAATQGYAPFAAGKVKTHLAADGVLETDNLSWPLSMPATSSGSGVKSNPFADPGIFSLDDGQQTASGAAFQIGTAVAAFSPEQQQLGTFDAGAALAYKQSLPSYGSLAGGSEWGSGNFTPHITSGIDTPTGSGIFRINPFAAGSDCGSASPGHLSTALEGLPSVLGRASIGASRMAREAAASAAAIVPFGGLTTNHSCKSSYVNISEITPASDDDDDDGDGNGDERDCGITGCEYADLQQKMRLVHDTTCSLQQVSKTGQRSPSGQAEGSTAAAAEDNAGSKASADGSSVSSMWCSPPGYAESIGAEADDEGSPSVVRLTSQTRQVWPASNIEAAGSGQHAGGSRVAVRHGAELVETTAGSGAGSVQDRNQLQGVNGHPAPLAGESGLVRRTPTSRTTSQLLSNNVMVSSDGMVVLPAPMYNYEDDDLKPLVQHQARLEGSTSGKVTRSMIEAQSQIGRVELHSFLSISTQWFDITALVVLGGQLMGAMGSPQLSIHQQLHTLLWIFAAGHLLWPVGCLLWPWVTARSGRRAALAWTLCLSAFPTALLGCMPAYSEGAGTGLIIIGALRFLSGIAANNDGAAAIAYLAEHAPQAPGLHTSVVPCAMATGALGAAVFASILAWSLSAVKLGVFGWRLVLVASLFAHGVSGMLRGFILQDPELHMSSALLSDRRNAHVWQVIRHHTAQVFMAVLMQVFSVSGLLLLTSWMPVYFTQYGQLPVHLALTLQAVNVAALTACIPFGGFLADQHGRIYVLLATCAAAALFAYPAWLLFSLAAAGVSWFSQFTLVVFVGLHIGALTGALGDMFQKGVRCSALTLVLALSMALLGGTTPLAALGLITRTGSLSSPAALIIITAVISAAAITHHELVPRN